MDGIHVETVVAAVDDVLARFGGASRSILNLVEAITGRGRVKIGVQ